MTSEQDSDKDSVTADAPATGKVLFFSYSHGDRGRAEPIIRALEAVGHSVWWDDNLDGGAAFSNSIEEALKAADAVVVLWSDKSIRSHWVTDEADQGRADGRLVPLTIDGVQPPLGFRQLHFIDMESWDGNAGSPEFIRIRRAIASAAGGHAPDMPKGVAAASAARESGSATNRRTLLIAGGAISLAGAAGIGALLMRGGSSLLAENGVAVLPFRNLSGDPQQDYLSAGLSAEVRAVLARNTALRVVAQASSEAVKNRALDAGQMAKALAVSFLLDGQVRQTGDSLRVTAELIDGRTGFSSWSETFERPIEELSRVQDAIANAVTVQLAINQPKGGVEGAYGTTADAAAFNAYLQGKTLYESAISHETDLAALSHFDQAIERDQHFGAAHAARARTLTVLGNTSDDVAKARGYYDGARLAAEHAVESGPESADAHSTLGYVLFQAQLRIKEAREPFKHSYDLGRGDAVVLARFASYAASTRQRDLANKAISRARDLDPLNALIQRTIASVRYAEGDFDGTIEAVERALELNPVLSDSHARIAMALIALGRPQEALVAAGKEKSGLFRYPALAIASHKLGDAAAANAAMNQLIEDYGDAGLYQQAQVLSLWGDLDAASAILQRAKDAGDSGLTYAFNDPALDPLRKRSDFKELLSALGYV